MKATVVVLIALWGLSISVAIAAGDSPTVPGADVSGAYYDWTKTKEPEKPYFHAYDQSLVMKFYMAIPRNKGNDCKVFMTFQQALDTIKHLDTITCGAPKIVYLVGWQYNGQDSRGPAWDQVNERLKRPEDKTALESLRWLIREGLKYNTTVSLHVVMIDAYTNSPLWNEYLAKDIIAKDKQGKALKGEFFTVVDQQSYQISYAREWELGLAQRRIDRLVAMVPELQDTHTIHIDAFHTYPPVPHAYPRGRYPDRDYSFTGISPYLGYTAEQEAATQRKIFRYFRDKYQMDVTCEGSTFLRFDPFVGLQPMAYHFNGPTVPPKLYCGTPFERAESIIQNAPQKLTGFLDMFCLSGVPFIWSNHWRHDDDTNQPQAADWAKVLQGGDVCLPLIWKKEKTLIAYSRGGYAGKTWGLPEEWKTVKSAAATRIASDGSKTEDAGTVEINDGQLTLTLKAGEALELVATK